MYLIYARQTINLTLASNLPGPPPYSVSNCLFFFHTIHESEIEHKRLWKNILSQNPAQLSNPLPPYGRVGAVPADLCQIDVVHYA